MSNPGASQQTKFRLNPKPTYSERMSETRGEIRRIMKEALRQITGDEVATMHWPTYWKDVVTRYHVIIEGWPDDVPFRNLSDVSNLGKLEQLLRGWQNGNISFRRISDAEFAALNAQREAGGSAD
ncbi:uncharacterized protein B0H18DRAFT_1118727 [Fomitopsis serialis]|uniref:uncharacterized protein n=1 Tax=Fomitopsis serialis TaxID=139415 RepID=UPI002008E428|nr:uncharacterized protein B0H18DRAFT_1118727 [Neoantrodia serialis]KAH9926987.1 hypothetical protein B0H18DRAFT_1118727 [Neoantrodia serialis]